MHLGPGGLGEEANDDDYHWLTTFPSQCGGKPTECCAKVNEYEPGREASKMACSKRILVSVRK